MIFRDINDVMRFLADYQVTVEMSHSLQGVYTIRLTAYVGYDGMTKVPCCSVWQSSVKEELSSGLFLAARTLRSTLLKQSRERKP